MSFSSRVKDELCRIDTNKECCLFSELSSVLFINGHLKYNDEDGMKITIVTENSPFARRLFSAIKKLFQVFPKITIRRSSKLKKHVLYILDVTNIVKTKSIIYKNKIKLDKPDTLFNLLNSSFVEVTGNRDCCKKAYLRGAFLSSGSLSDPEKTYHLEIYTHSKALAEELCTILDTFKLNAKSIERKGSFVVYIKEGEDIVDFLNIIGAHNALMELENIRILKEMRNNVNRAVNCETANLQKTVDASIRQVENIMLIDAKIGLDNIPVNLKDIARLRLEFSDLNLKELGEMLSPPLGKSGVNHRLRKLDELAESIK